MVALKRLPHAGWPEYVDQVLKRPGDFRSSPTFSACLSIVLMLTSACAPTTKGSVKDLVDAEVFVHVRQNVSAGDREKAEDLDNAEGFLLKYLAEPGKEYYAAHVARLRPDAFLPVLDALLDDDANIQMRPRAMRSPTP